MSTIWLNCEVSRIETGNRLFNAIDAQNSVSYSNTCSLLLVTRSEKKAGWEIIQCRVSSSFTSGNFQF